MVYNVESARSGRFISHVMLTNMTPAPIENWIMSFQMDAPVTAIEHVAWSRVGTIYDVQGSGWTKRIEPGDMVWFTINGLINGYAVETPRSCTFNNVACTIEAAPMSKPVIADAQDLMFSAWIADEGVTTFAGHIIIQNPTDHPVENWTLTFSSESLITEINHVDWVRSGSIYSVSGTAWTSTIPASGFVWFDFRGVHTGEAQLPSACSFGGVACEFMEPDRLIEICCNFEVRVEVYYVDDNTFRAVFFVENPDVNHLDFWKLRFSWTANVTEMDGVKWTRSAGKYTVIGEGPKKRILAGRDVWFEIRGTYTDVVEPPENCSINSVPCTIESIGTTTIVEEPEQDEPDPPKPGP
ncbi:MAG: cellulose binding domain-containing protein, partial [Bacteroidetes bacterium]|nr:cellulose binding domain-containing protein [Bacteroidota bacterium]